MKYKTMTGLSQSEKYGNQREIVLEGYPQCLESLGDMVFHRLLVIPSSADISLFDNPSKRLRIKTLSVFSPSESSVLRNIF